MRSSDNMDLLNLWNKIEFFCGNHKEPIPFVIQEGSSKFFACPKYMLKDDKHPDGHELHERACPNRISFDDAGSIMMALQSVMSNAASDPDEIINFNGYCFKHKTYDITIMKYNEYTGKIKISIINRKALL